MDRLEALECEDAEAEAAAAAAVAPQTQMLPAGTLVRSPLLPYHLFLLLHLPSPPPPPLHVPSCGAQVTVHGLAAAAHHNGKRGLILGFDGENGRHAAESNATGHTAFPSPSATLPLPTALAYPGTWWSWRTGARSSFSPRMSRPVRREATGEPPPCIPPLLHPTPLHPP